VFVIILLFAGGLGFRNELHFLLPKTFLEGLSIDLPELIERVMEFFCVSMSDFFFMVVGFAQG
jgi:hypothetical protein